MKVRLAFAVVAHCVVLLSAASGHYLWVAVDPKAGEHGTVHVYFEEGPGPGTGEYLDPFVSAGQTWIRTIDSPQPQALPLKETTQPNRRWLSAPLPVAAPRSIDSYGKWGVYRYGQTDVLLHYYARMLDVQTHEQMHELARAPQMRLDIVPHEHGSQVDLRVLWEGKPAAERTVYIRGPGGFNRNLKTDANGKVRFEAEAAGRYTIRTNVEEDKSGKDGDKQYALIRHHATLVLYLPLKK